MKRNRLIRVLIWSIVLIVTSSITVGGDAMDINNKLIATTISVDKKDGEVWFYVEFANIEASKGSSNSTGSSGNQYILIKGHGKTFVEARQNLNRQLDKPLYMGGVRTLLLTQRFAEDDLVEYLYRLRVDETYRKKIITITTQDDLDALFKTMNDKNQSLGYSIENTINTLDSTGDASLRTTSRLLENLSDSYTGILIPCVGLQEKEVAFVGYTVVRDTKAVGFIPVEDCVGLNMIKADQAKSFYVVPYQNQRFSVEATVKKQKVEAAYQDGRANFTFTLSFEGILEYGSMKTPYGLTIADKEALSDIVEQLILKDLLTAFDQAQNIFQTDFLQCDDAFRVKYPALFRSMNWHDTFVQASMTAKVKIDLLTTHMLDYGDSVAR